MAPAVAIDPAGLLVLEQLWRGGHAAYVVGGSVRDALLGRPVWDWDITTDALPERILELLSTGRYENRFGTVTVMGAPPTVQVTTFRRDHRYRDHRRPDSVTFTTDLVEDLARRDFTVNAIAYGLPAGAPADRCAAGELDWVDPTGGMEDLARRTLRAVGDPAARFDEDALRLLRGVRLAAQLRFELDPSTRQALIRAAPTARWLSGERVGQELRRMLESDPPSAALWLMDELSLLDPTLPELAQQRGMPQNKVSGMDLLGHTLATLDAAAELTPNDPRQRLAALYHDVGKPETRTDDGFHGHDTAGALTAERALTRMAFPRTEVATVAQLVRHHMFTYEARWSDAAVRRFIRRVGPDLLPRLIALRRADNIGSGLPADAGGLAELEARVAAQLDRDVPLTLADLAVNGRDLQAEVGVPPGPELGAILERLLESVINDPERNVRGRLLADARHWWRHTAPADLTARADVTAQLDLEEADEPVPTAERGR